MEMGKIKLKSYNYKEEGTVVYIQKVEFELSE